MRSNTVCHVFGPSVINIPVLHTMTDLVPESMFEIDDVMLIFLLYPSIPVCVCVFIDGCSEKSPCKVARVLVLFGGIACGLTCNSFVFIRIFCALVLGMFWLHLSLFSLFPSLNYDWEQQYIIDYIIYMMRLVLNCSYVILHVNTPFRLSYQR